MDNTGTLVSDDTTSPAGKSQLSKHPDWFLDPMMIKLPGSLKTPSLIVNCACDMEKDKTKNNKNSKNRISRYS